LRWRAAKRLRAPFIFGGGGVFGGGLALRGAPKHAAPKMIVPWDRKMENPVQFLQEVRSEGAKVTWPTRKETLVTTGGVFVMVLAASAFFFFVDQILHWSVGLILGIGR
jgi:preprotein translocase subunit SecE